MKTITAASETQSRQVLQWVNWAGKDYFSARMVLLEGLLVPGAIFSNTAIEKYLKAVCLVAQIPFPKTHRVPELEKLIRSKEIKLKLREDYLRLISKAYELRYPDNLPIGYNICLSQAKLLTELDFTVFKIRKGFGFRLGPGKDVATRLQMLLESKDKTIIESNCTFGSTARAQVFREKNRHYELRVIEGGNIIEAEYQTDGTKDDEIFDVVALKPSLGPRAGQP